MISAWSHSLGREILTCPGGSRSQPDLGVCHMTLGLFKYLSCRLQYQLQEKKRLPTCVLGLPYKPTGYRGMIREARTLPTTVTSQRVALTILRFRTEGGCWLLFCCQLTFDGLTSGFQQLIAIKDSCRQNYHPRYYTVDGLAAGNK